MGLGSLLFGKKDKGTPDRFIELDPSLKRNVEAGRNQQLKGINALGSEIDKISEGPSAKDVAGAQVQNLERRTRANAKDQEMKAKELVAQRGIGNSSVGLNAILNTSENLGNKVNEVRAQAPLLENQAQGQKLSLLKSAQGGINQSLMAPGQQKTFVQGRAGGGRKGGISGLLGATAGAMMGGPGGALVGMKLGQGLGQTLGNL